MILGFNIEFLDCILPKESYRCFNESFVSSPVQGKCSWDRLDRFVMMKNSAIVQIENCKGMTLLLEKKKKKTNKYVFIFVSNLFGFINFLAALL